MGVLQVVLGALTLDETRTCRAVAALGRQSPDESALRAAVADAVRQVRRGQFPGLDWLLGLLDRLAICGSMRFPEELVLFRKAVLTLSAAVADVSENCSPDRVLLGAGMEQFFRELAGRALASHDCRAFGTHVSNADLFSLWASLPATAARFWLGTWQDALESGQAVGRGASANRQ